MPATARQAEYPALFDGMKDDAAVEEDLRIVAPWWRALAQDVPSETAALWFGMVDLITDSGSVRHLYAAGCPSFDAADETGDWATEYVWWPQNRYVVAPKLANHAGDYRAVLKHAAAVVQRLSPQRDVAVQGVAVGYDEGDFIVTFKAQ